VRPAAGIAIWVGADEQIFNRHKAVLDAMRDQPTYIGPIGARSIAKLVHNCTGVVLVAALAEVFTMGVKAGVGPGRSVGGYWPGRCAHPTASPTSTCPVSTTRAISSGASNTRMSAGGRSQAPGRRADAACQPRLRGIGRGDEPRRGTRNKSVSQRLPGRARRHPAGCGRIAAMLKADKLK
jgi:hypothetical protein